MSGWWAAVGASLLLLCPPALGDDKLCYSCHNCPEVSQTNTPVERCQASCATYVTCLDHGKSSVSRRCGVSIEQPGCIKDPTGDSYTCYCDYDYCDALYGRDPCNAGPATRAHTLVLAAAVVPLLLLLVVF